MAQEHFYHVCNTCLLHVRSKEDCAVSPGFCARNKMPRSGKSEKIRGGSTPDRLAPGNTPHVSHVKVSIAAWMCIVTEKATGGVMIV